MEHIITLHCLDTGGDGCDREPRGAAATLDEDHTDNPDIAGETVGRADQRR